MVLSPPLPRRSRLLRARTAPIGGRTSASPRSSTERGASLAGLALTWFGPWTEIASNLLLNEVYLIALQVCMIISVDLSQ